MLLPIMLSMLIANSQVGAAPVVPNYWLYRKIYNPDSAQVISYCRYTQAGEVWIDTFANGYPEYPYSCVLRAPMDVDKTLPFVRTTIAAAANGNMQTAPGPTLKANYNTEYGAYDTVSGKTFILQVTGRKMQINDAPDVACLVALIEAFLGNQ